MDLLRPELTLRRIVRAARRTPWFAAVAAALAVSCGDASADGVRRTSSTAGMGEGGSPVSLDSALALFRRDLDPVTALENAEPSMERVIARLARSVETSDTAVLRALVMSRREFAYLYYPTSPFTRLPTKQEPGLAWFLHLHHSQKGATRLFGRYAGKPLRIVRNDCQSPPRVEGLNVMWDNCVQLLVEGRDTVTTRLFGGVYEREGRFKVFSYGNDL